jgi:tripartite-type tricarboxylate transporter receptor subunit TctC
MKLSHHQFLHLAAGAAALPAVSRIAWGQTYPSRPVGLIVGFPAGQAIDIYARLIGQWLQERLGQPFIVENGEVRYIRRRAADHTGRVISIGQLILFSTKSGDAWLLDPSDQLAARLARDGDPEPIHIEETEGQPSLSDCVANLAHMALTAGKRSSASRSSMRAASTGWSSSCQTSIERGVT